MNGARTPESDPTDGLSVYLVGGAVRDSLLGRPVKERDWVVVGASVEQMEARGFRAVGKDFPVFLHPQTHEEYALARTERKTAPGYHGFAVHAAPDVTLEQDLERRDLTVNAMAQGVDGQLVDPFGGREDLEQRLLRHVSEAFAEDPVRILRLARFTARYAPLGFKPAPETLALCRRMVAAGEVDSLVPERVWQEWSRALLEPQPQAFLSVLQSCGALARLAPDLDRLLQEPAGEHGLRALTFAADHDASLPVRFAVLVYGLRENPGGDGGGAGLQRLNAICARLRVPSDCAELARTVAVWQDAFCQLEREQKAAPVLDLLEGVDAFRRPERFALFRDAAVALAQADDAISVARAEAVAGLLESCRREARAVTGRQFAESGLKGPAVGEAVRAERSRRLADLLSR